AQPLESGISLLRQPADDVSGRPQRCGSIFRRAAALLLRDAPERLRRVGGEGPVVDDPACARRHLGDVGPGAVAPARGARAVRRRLTSAVEFQSGAPMSRIRFGLVLTLVCLVPSLTVAQRGGGGGPAASAGPFGALRGRNVGPARGGRS